MYNGKVFNVLSLLIRNFKNNGNLLDTKNHSERMGRI